MWEVTELQNSPLATFIAPSPLRFWIALPWGIFSWSNFLCLWEWVSAIVGGALLMHWATLCNTGQCWATLVNTGQLWAILGQSGKADAALNSRPLKTLPTISGKIQPVSAAGFLSNQTAETNFRLRLCFLNLHLFLALPPILTRLTDSDHLITITSDVVFGQYWITNES